MPSSTPKSKPATAAKSLPQYPNGRVVQVGMPISWTDTGWSRTLPSAKTQPEKFTGIASAR